MDVADHIRIRASNGSADRGCWSGEQLADRVCWSGDQSADRGVGGATSWPTVGWWG